MFCFSQTRTEAFTDDWYPVTLPETVKVPAFAYELA